MRDYVFLNRVFVIVGGILCVVFLMLTNAGAISCTHLTFTGEACGSCGVTRDFISYLHFEFDNPLNKYSFNLFIFGLAQLIYRCYVSLTCISSSEDEVILSTRNLLEKNHFTLDSRSDRNIKKVITTDVMITFILTIIVFLPFWI